jgi:CheY-like chemotaxis protein
MAVTVLIVDDHPSFRATDGTEAIAEAERLRPDLVLLDVNLPDIDGFEVASRLTKAANGTPSSGPAVILTSSRDPSDFGSLVHESGARGFIPKAELSGAALAALLG